MPTIVECPHCYTHVIPTSAGDCPACSTSMSKVAEADSDKTSFSIDHEAALQPYCCGCGTPTDRYVRVVQRISRERDSRDSSAQMLTVLVLVGGWMVLPFAWLFGFRGRIGDTMVVRMPQCQACAADGTPVPLRVNSEELRMTFVVHKTFKERNQPDLRKSRAGTAKLE